MTPGVVIVAYGAPDLLSVALSVIDDLPTVVVDNSSLSAIRSLCDPRSVIYVDPGSNLGFATGVNRGIAELWRRHGKRDVLLLNPDASLSASDILRLQAALHTKVHTAAVSPRLVGTEGEQRAGWPFPSPIRMWRESLGMLGASRDDCEWLVGASLLISAKAYEDIGPFDERFFLYSEETDWQKRAVLGGWRVRLVPELLAQHAGAGTSNDPRRREALFHAGTETYVRKWHGTRGWASYRVAALVGAAARSVLPGARGAGARGRVALYLKGPRRAAGLD